MPSEETDTSNSLATDQSKSGAERERECQRERKQCVCVLPLTGLLCPVRVATRDGGSVVTLKTERVPSREAHASLLLSSLANLMAVTGECVCVQDREFGTDSWLTSILVSVKYMVHATKGIVVREGDISSHGSASSSRVGGD